MTTPASPLAAARNARNVAPSELVRMTSCPPAPPLIGSRSLGISGGRAPGGKHIADILARHGRPLVPRRRPPRRDGAVPRALGGVGRARRRRGWGRAAEGQSHATRIEPSRRVAAGEERDRARAARRDPRAARGRGAQPSTAHPHRVGPGRRPAGGAAEALAVQQPDLRRTRELVLPHPLRSETRELRARVARVADDRSDIDALTRRRERLEARDALVDEDARAVMIAVAPVMEADADLQDAVIEAADRTAG